MVKVAARTGRANFLPSLFGRDLGRFAHFQVAENVLQNHHRVIDQARERQRQTAQHHRVDRPAAGADGQKAASAESGIERKTAAVARMLPRNSRIINPVSTKSNRAFVQQILDRLLHEDGLIEHHLGDKLLGNISQIADSASLIPFTTAIVLVSPPCFRIGR